jgi:serine/threonine protein phosphatase PrpC
VGSGLKKEPQRFGRQEPGSPGASGPGQADAQPEQLKATKLSDVGQLRPHNEDYVDSVVPSDPAVLQRKGALYLVADGMGGHQAGEVASQTAVETVIQQYYADPSNNVRASLIRAFEAANRSIHQQAQTSPATAGMGTTLVAAVIRGHKVHIANVGDSRAYLINKRGISQITDDHSWVEEQVRAGLLTRKQARRHPQRNLVTRALGSRPSVDVDLFEIHKGKRDTILLCSDGLTNHVEDTEIEAALREHPVQGAAQALVALANERGGSDNISLLFVGPSDGAPAVTGGHTVREIPAIAVLTGAVAVVVLLAIALWLPGLLTHWPTLPFLARPSPVMSPAAVGSAATENPTGAGSVATVEQGVTSQLPSTTLERGRPAPELVQPTEESGGPLRGRVTFQWRYPRPLGDDEAFQVLIWMEGEVHGKAAESVSDTEQSIDLDATLPGKGGPGVYYWSVVVLDRETGDWLSPEAPAWRLIYAGPE